MYAVIESGGKQYRVELGAEIQVDRLDVQPGDSITLDRVLLVADGDATAVGRPLVDGASVSAHVLRQERGDKIVVFKYKPKARTRVKTGARADLTRLRIADIAFSGRSAAEDAKASQSEQDAAAQEAEKAAAEKAAADQALAAKLASAEAEAAVGKTTTASRTSPEAEALVAAAEAEVTAEPEAAAEPAEPEATKEPAAVKEVEAATEPETADEADTRKDD